MKKYQAMFITLRLSLILFLLPIVVYPTASTAQTGVPTNALPPALSTQNNVWNTLTPLQKQALAPLASDWNTFDINHKQKWIQFANKFGKLSPDEQKRVQEKMQKWANLTPQQRLAARENYIRSNQFQPDQRNQKWQEYQQLTDEQKSQLALHPEQKTLITNLPTPAESKIKKLQPLKTPHIPTTTLPGAKPPSPNETIPNPTNLLIPPTSELNGSSLPPSAASEKPLPASPDVSSTIKN